MRLHCALAIVALALLGGCGAGDATTVVTHDAATGAIRSYEPYSAGPSFLGLRLKVDANPAVNATDATYGTCRPSGDAGCPAPLSIETASICSRNPLVLDLRPVASTRERGAPVRVYAEGDRSLEVGDANVTVFATKLPIDRVLAALRPLDRERPAARLPRPRYPRAYVLELRRVRDAYLRLGSVRAVRGELGISQSAVRFRLRLAEELGRRRLRRPAADFESNGACAVEPVP